MLNLKALEYDSGRVSIPITNLPEFINLLEMNQRVTQIELKLVSNDANVSLPDGKTIGIERAAEMLGLSKSRVYVLSGQGKLPTYKNGNRILFFTDELEKYIRSGRKLAYKNKGAAL